MNECQQSGNMKNVSGFVLAPAPLLERNSCHDIAAADADPNTETRFANVISFGSDASSTWLFCTTISSPHFQGDRINSLFTVATRAPSPRTASTRHQKRSPRIPTFINTPTRTLGLFECLSHTSNMFERRISAALLEACMATSTPPKSHSYSVMLVSCWQIT